jgi:uncharacterized protein YraI
LLRNQWGLPSFKDGSRTSLKPHDVDVSIPCVGPVTSAGVGTAVEALPSVPGRVPGWTIAAGVSALVAATAATTVSTVAAAAKAALAGINALARSGPGTASATVDEGLA